MHCIKLWEYLLNRLHASLNSNNFTEVNEFQQSWTIKAIDILLIYMYKYRIHLLLLVSHNWDLYPPLSVGLKRCYQPFCYTILAPSYSATAWNFRFLRLFLLNVALSACCGTAVHYTNTVWTGRRCDTNFAPGHWQSLLTFFAIPSVSEGKLLTNTSSRPPTIPS